jgi:ubiquinone/menaquinone biosynthesis C-methylase UbiE
MRRRLVQLVTHAMTRQKPDAALRELLQIDTDVTGLINETAIVYGNGVHVKHRLMRYHDFFVDRVKAGDRVLDIGCGYGAVANSVASRTPATVVGLDMSEKNVADARRMFPLPNLAFVVGEAPRDVPNEHFDVVMISNVIEHIEGRVAFLKDVQARVTPNRWLVRVPMFDREWRVPMRQELGLYYFGDPTHYIEYTRETFDAEMSDAGFGIDETQINWGEIWAQVSCR